MNWKQVIKPDWKKLVIFLSLIFLVIIIGQLFIFIKENIFILSFGPLDHSDYIWLPLSSGEFEPFNCGAFTGRPCPAVNTGGHMGAIVFEEFKVNYTFIGLNLIFWYLISCLIVWIYDKFRKPKKR